MKIPGLSWSRFQDCWLISHCLGVMRKTFTVATERPHPRHAPRSLPHLYSYPCFRTPPPSMPFCSTLLSSPGTGTSSPLSRDCSLLSVSKTPCRPTFPLPLFLRPSLACLSARGRPSGLILVFPCSTCTFPLGTVGILTTGPVTCEPRASSVHLKPPLPLSSGPVLQTVSSVHQQEYSGTPEFNKLETGLWLIPAPRSLSVTVSAPPGSSQSNPKSCSPSFNPSRRQVLVIQPQNKAAARPCRQHRRPSPIASHPDPVTHSQRAHLPLHGFSPPILPTHGGQNPLLCPG